MAPVIVGYVNTKLKVQTGALARVWGTDLVAFNARAQQKNHPRRVS
jgi:hypothetical protein